MRLIRPQLLIGFLVIAACGGKAAVVTAPTPAGRLDDAKRLARSGRWAKALPILQRLAFDLPPGRAELPEVAYLTGEALFQTGSFTEAATQFHQTADQFPETPYAPLALLRAGDANLRRWRKPQLDPTSGEAALADYQELVGRYPDSEAAARGGLHVKRLRNWFGQKTYMNGVFYQRRKAYDSAIIYYKEVVATFSDTRWAPEALLKLVESYGAIGYNEERKETCEHLRRYYPNFRFAPDRCPATPTASNSP